MFAVGVDLGQQSDYTATAVVRKEGEDLHVVHLERVPLHTSYTDVAAHVIRLCENPRLEVDGQGPLLVIDETGVGRGVADILGTYEVPFCAVSITSGGTPRPYARKGLRVSWRVSKAVLIEALERPLRNGNLKIANGLPWGMALAEELQSFRRKVDPKTAHVRYEHATSSDKDDLVLAVALACWGSSSS